MKEGPTGQTYRLYVDFTKLTVITKPEEYPIRDQTALRNQFQESRVFIILAMKVGFHIIKIYLDTIPLLGMARPDKLYIWKRMPFGVLGSMYFFQYIVDLTLGKDPMVQALSFLDDIITLGEQREML